MQAAGQSFNEGYRYVDWLLTVPLPLTGAGGRWRSPRSCRLRRWFGLIPASALMIALGYPGEISADTATRNIWGLLSTIPFLYILYVLFVEIDQVAGPPTGVGALNREPDANPATRDVGVYPIALLFCRFTSRVRGQAVGRHADRLFGLADILAKCLFGLLIYKIARLKPRGRSGVRRRGRAISKRLSIASPAAPPESRRLRPE